jgi:pimeloyl-ACP methyl ester carboxylesterase
MSELLRRRFLQVSGRRVHLWTGGDGPAVILIHGSPGNAWLVLPLARRLCRHFTVYAVDTPGFGASDALPGERLSVAHLADAYRDILDAIGLTAAAVYGTHSGAAIGLELARRHPSRVSGFVLEGVPAFTVEEQEPLLAPEYLIPFDPDLLGGHYSRAWTRFHDQFLWFPWYRRDPGHLNEGDAGSAADIHLWVEMSFQASRHDYRPAYRAVIAYGGGALAAAREVTTPGVYLAESSDMLFGHLDRLPPPGAGQRIERVMSPDAVAPAVEAALRSLPGAAAGAKLPASPTGARQSFCDLPGGEIFVRSAGAGERRPVLLLHDAPGAGHSLEDLCWALSAFGPVILPDLPGCGESDPLGSDVPDLAAVADAVAALLAGRRCGPVNVYAAGFGAAVALELNARRPDLVHGLALCGVLRVGATERRAMLGRLAPPIALADDGSHWYRTWLMLRDSLVHWPWYGRSPATLRRQPLAFDPLRLHAWTCEVMRQWSSYHHLIDAVLGWDPAPAIEAARGKLTVAIDPLHALAAADTAWAAAGLPAMALPADPADRARSLNQGWPA